MAEASQKWQGTSRDSQGLQAYITVIMTCTVRKTEEHTIGVSMKDTKGREAESKHVTSLTNGRDCHWPSLSGWTAMTHPTAGMVQSIRASR